jgi:hypothetical protein
VKKVRKYIILTYLFATTQRMTAKQFTKIAFFLEKRRTTATNFSNICSFRHNTLYSQISTGIQTTDLRLTHDETSALQQDTEVPA